MVNKAKGIGLGSGQVKGATLPVVGLAWMKNAVLPDTRALPMGLVIAILQGIRRPVPAIAIG